MRYFEDFTVGQVITYPGPTVSAADIVAFAREYDPQPFHLSEEAAKGTFAGRLIASGWHTACLHMRMLVDGLLRDAAGLGAPGIDELRWLKPVVPGDTLRARSTVLDLRRSSKGNRGFVRFAFEVLNQQDDVVMAQTNSIMFACRTTEMGDRSAGPAAPKPPPPPTPPSRTLTAAEALRQPMPYLEDLVPGERIVLGEKHFDEAGIIAFAKDYDPQYFHIDVAAAKDSPFGGLIASGWQTAACWMRLLVDFRMGQVAASHEAGTAPVKLGPSPGFSDARWVKPVFSGDTITCATTLLEARPSASRPGWGLARSHNTGVNQRGELVFEFTSAVFWGMRGS
jgi:acyl dehydratase